MTPLTPAKLDDLSRALENERTLNALLRTVVQRKPFREIILECLDLLLSVSWLSILPKGGVFLVQEEPDVLVLVAQRDLPPELLTLCARVPFGRCLCGRAAASRRLIYAGCIDERHEIQYGGIGPHGHYNVPILDGSHVMGVLVLYLPHGHACKESETRFLSAFAYILSMVVKQKHVEEELEEAVQRLRRLAYVDVLTELYNRRFLMDRLDEEVSRAHRLGWTLSALIIDVDRFKAVNDTYGHQAGDAVLRVISQRLRTVIRKYDVIGRIGGEEFCLVLPNTDIAQAVKIAERARCLIDHDEIEVDGKHSIRITVSIGAASLKSREMSAQLLARADAALYQAKECGRNRVEYAVSGSHDLGENLQSSSSAH